MKKIMFSKPIRVKCVVGNKRQFPIEGKVYEAVATDVRGELYFEGVFPDHKKMERFEQVRDYNTRNGKRDEGEGA